MMSPAFIKNASFCGTKQGYVFKRGEKGMGYYEDAYGCSLSYGMNGHDYKDLSKRERDDSSHEQDLDGSSQRKQARKDLSTKIDALAEAEAAVDLSETIKELDPQSLKMLLATFEKKINENQKARMKHSNNPSKFMASEVELHAALQDLYTVRV